jgi:hypothetical protein
MSWLSAVASPATTVESAPEAEKDTDGHIRNELVAYNRGKLLAQHGFGIREAQARDLRPGPNAPVARQDGRTGREIVLE